MTPRSDAPLLDRIAARITELADAVGGQVSTRISWFDGFWDFVLEYRERMASSPIWEIQGDSWAIVFISSKPLESQALEAHIFVDAKDRRPGIRAPWPVSSVVLGGDEPPGIGARDRFDRPHRVDLADALRAVGFEPLVGYWGVHAQRLVTCDPRDPAASLAALFEATPRALSLALELHKA